MKIRYKAREAQAALGIGNSKFWQLVKAGHLAVYYDGRNAYCTPESLKAYDRQCRANTAPPAGGARRKGRGAA